MWGLIHIMFLVSFRTKLTVMLDWFLNYRISERGSRITTGDPEIKIKEIRGAKMMTGRREWIRKVESCNHNESSSCQV